MFCTNPTDCRASGLTAYGAEQLQAERIVLAFLIEEHPAQLTGDFKSNDVVVAGALGVPLRI